jgi:hypothetical protein
MYPRFDRFRNRNRLFVGLVTAFRIDGKARQTRLGPLGSVALPLNPSERMRFWAAINQRFLAIGARHPGLVSPADEARIRAAIEERIPLPAGPAGRRLLQIATVQRDLMTPFDTLDHAEDAVAEAARRLKELRAERELIAEERATQS